MGEGESKKERVWERECKRVGRRVRGKKKRKETKGGDRRDLRYEGTLLYARKPHACASGARSPRLQVRGQPEVLAGQRSRVQIPPKLRRATTLGGSRMTDGWQLAWVPTLAPTFARLVSLRLQPVPILPVLAGLLGLGYICAAGCLWRRRRPWPVSRTASFVVGCVLLVAISGTATEGYGFRMFSVFMFQQLTLMIVIPPLLILGSPFRLALRSVPHRGVLGEMLRVATGFTFSRTYRLMLHPGFSIPLFLLTYYGLYLTSAGSVLLSSWWGHNLLELGFLVSGVLFAVPLFTLGPGPIHPTYLSRILDVFAEMALHAFFGVLIMLTPLVMVTAFGSPPLTWGVDPLADQEIAGGLAWSYGEGPAMLTVIYLVRRWYRDETSRARLRDRRSSADGDLELEAYNARLAQLAHGSHSPEISTRTVPTDESASAPKGHTSADPE